MSYLVRLKDADPRQDRSGASAYKILDSGVLQIIIQSDDENGSWEIDTEYSPSAWSSVAGTPFDGPTRQMKGDGKVVNGEYIS
ncbi:hypothetical protein OIT41_08690 [Arthrobacter sp. YA7-1]|uniref:hypothetical protein n=1 Tax=Arthrobacter sp. YA7-1 TaxID=2987701 RepID=UPI00222632B8|nr:hypothetical protein [Arthrobacter sp. YA7-1]UYY83091.1 hypothetical protein OIT41_08690 [Arthrobacter sp. YA7-1]